MLYFCGKAVKIVREAGLVILVLGINSSVASVKWSTDKVAEPDWPRRPLFSAPMCLIRALQPHIHSPDSAVKRLVMHIWEVIEAKQTFA